MNQKTNIFISTGGYHDKTAFETATMFLENGITGIELSGGQHDPQDLQNLKTLLPKANLQLHNYFPPPKEPFVLNLASFDENIHKNSMEHCQKAIDYCEVLGSKYFAVHAGFLIEPKVSELGKPISVQKLYDRNDAKEKFIDSINSLGEYANSKNIKLLFENNVLSHDNKTKFGRNPLLCTSPDETAEILEKTHKNVNLLVDVAHLKVSARSLGFDPVEFFSHCESWIQGYHLSDNDGTQDSNESFDEKAWFWPYLKKSIDYICIEVYRNTLQNLKYLEKITNQILAN
jgi:sugar phosphate isomerase/epimerase